MLVESTPLYPWVGIRDEGRCWGRWGWCPLHLCVTAGVPGEGEVGTQDVIRQVRVAATVLAATVSTKLARRAMSRRSARRLPWLLCSSIEGRAGGGAAVEASLSRSVTSDGAEGEVKDVAGDHGVLGARYWLTWVMLEERLGEARAQCWLVWMLTMSVISCTMPWFSLVSWFTCSSRATILAERLLCQVDVSNS